MNLEKEKPAIKSNLWGTITTIFLLAGLGLMGVYIWQFADTIMQGKDFVRFDAFRQFHATFITVVLFYLVFLLFLIGLWSYSLFVDLNNIFKPFNYRPTDALFVTMLPVINFYGFGWAITRIIRVFEHEKLRFTYRDFVYPLKLSLTATYAGLSGIMISLFFALNMRVNEQVFYGNKFIGFHGVEFFLMLLSVIGLIWTINSTRKIIRAGLKEEFIYE